jgi:hypothetical protein
MVGSEGVKIKGLKKRNFLFKFSKFQESAL